MVEFWDRTPLQEQQDIFGRAKYSAAPLGKKHEHDAPDYASDPDGKRIPKDSHMRLANPRDPEFLKNISSTAVPTTTRWACPPPNN